MENGTKPVGTLVTAFDIIDELKESGGMSVSELATQLDKPRSTVHSHLATLENLSYLTSDEGEYRLGLRFLGVGENARKRMRIYEVVSPEVERLAEDTGELATAVVEEHGMGVFLCRNRGEDAVNLDSHDGYRVHLHTTAVGKAILAHLDEERIEGILDEHGLVQNTENTVTDREELFEELATIREEGVAFDREERLRGLNCVAAPILRNDGTVIGSISLAGPTSRFRGDLFETEYPELVKSAANIVELDIEYK
ncbi:IclR family transcriptional regulator [Haloarcula sp. GH36]|uniref:IclR family transcriptional regulator n=1 Tax=Haloarcula montana TaxID=3111776 RepID=UPI002D78543A|nr:IclR family transcriptional regulator [Haloarcula sp. GH36]